MKVRFTLSFVVVGFLLSSCKDAGTSAENPDSDKVEVPAVFEVVDVQPAEAAKIFASGEVAVLDVRTPEEFGLGHLPDANLANIRDHDFDAQVAQLDMSRPYLVHCQAGVPGGRSRKAVESLRKAGATRVYHLEGGYFAWEQAGHPTEK